jgi:hypothetical protein
MALQVKHKIVPNNSNRNIVFTETTGVYSSTNLTGYGAAQIPTGTRETSDVVNSTLDVFNYNGTINFNGGEYPILVDDIYTIDFNGVTAQAIAAGAPQTIDLGTLIPDEYIDSVYKSVYYNWFNALDVVNNYSSNAILVNDYNEFLNASYVDILFDGIHYIYEIVSINQALSTVTVNGTLPDLTDASCKIGYSSIAYFASTFFINKCLHDRVAKLAISSCTCDNKCTEKLYEAVMLYMSIQPNMDLGKYQKAQDIIEYLNNYCNDGCCNC